MRQMTLVDQQYSYLLQRKLVLNSEIENLKAQLGKEIEGSSMGKVHSDIQTDISTKEA